MERAAEAGYFLSARSYFSYGNLKPWDKVKQASKEKWREWARLMRDEYETIPMFCPMCGGWLEQLERKE